MVELGAVGSFLPTGRSAHADTFVRDNLPVAADWPRMDFSSLPAYPAQLNAAAELLDRHVHNGHGQAPALWFEGQSISYADLLAWSNRLARTLTEDLQVVPGNRVLLRGFNTPSMVAAWLAVLKVGAVVVTTMPLLRARELSELVEKAHVQVALCDGRLAEEMQRLTVTAPRTVFFGPDAGAESLESLMANKPIDFANVDTAADDPCMIAFTSGTTGKPK